MSLRNKIFKNPYDNGFIECFINIFYAVGPFGPTAWLEIVSYRAIGG